MAKSSLKISREDERYLTERYLLWMYKTTKEEVDKIDRKFTQLVVDERIQRFLDKRHRLLKKSWRQGLSPFLKEWKEYIFQKESQTQALRADENGEPDYHYLFLRLKLEAVETVVSDLLGKKALKAFKRLYQEFARERILRDASNRR